MNRCPHCRAIAHPLRYLRDTPYRCRKCGGISVHNDKWTEFHKILAGLLAAAGASLGYEKVPLLQHSTFWLTVIVIVLFVAGFVLVDWTLGRMAPADLAECPMNEDPSQPLAKCSNHDAVCAPPPGRNLRRISRWLGWACWLALGMFVAVALIHRELGWDQWRARLHYPGWGLCLAVLAYGMVSAFGLFRSTSVSSAEAGFFAIGAIVQLFNLLDWSHDPKDIESLHKAAVMMSIYTVVLALMYARSGSCDSADAKSASEVARTNSSMDEH